MQCLGKKKKSQHVFFFLLANHIRRPTRVLIRAGRRHSYPTLKDLRGPLPRVTKDILGRDKTRKQTLWSSAHCWQSSGLAVGGGMLPPFRKPIFTTHFQRAGMKRAGLSKSQACCSLGFPGFDPLSPDGQPAGGVDQLSPGPWPYPPRLASGLDSVPHIVKWPSECYKWSQLSIY